VFEKIVFVHDDHDDGCTTGVHYREEDDEGELEFHGTYPGRAWVDEISQESREDYFESEWDMYEDFRHRQGEEMAHWKQSTYSAKTIDPIYLTDEFVEIEAPEISFVFAVHT